MSAWGLTIFAVALLSVFGQTISYRLPQNNPTPITYEVFLSPDLVNNVFEGRLTLTVTPTINVNTITLHVKNLTWENPKITPIGGTQDLFSTYTEDLEKDFLIISLTEPLVINTIYSIEINYTGILHDDMYGFYRSTYQNEYGNTTTIAATQFQPTYARRAFPCFDEPKYKATFKISIDTPAGYTSICNTPLVNSPTVGQRDTYIFGETMQMSTYLVAFVVSDFVSLNVTRENSPILFQTWARSNAIQSGGQYSIDVTPDILFELERYTDIPYNISNLTKVDQVALPDFSAGAMENWGLVTYRERLLLWTEGVSTSANMQSIASIISHELAHMWFGNLVTTDWWDTLWLNEGFATYFENYITSLVDPTFRIMDQFVVSVHQSVFATDALTSAHPLSHECESPSEVSAMFSAITYSKGGSVLRMLNHSMTGPRFTQALSNYLKERQFDTSLPSHLMVHLHEQARSTYSATRDINFTSAVISWTEQPGFPVVKVERNYDGINATVSQSRFLLTGANGTEKLLYYVPLNWATEDGDFEDTEPKVWLTEDSIEIDNLTSAEKWVIFNIQETGFYRVNYDEKNWELLSNALKTEPTKIHFLNRAQLIDDSLNLARIGDLPYSTALDILGSLANEEDYIPWLSGFNGLTFLNRRLRGHSDYNLFTKFVLELLTNIYNKLDFVDAGTHDQKLHRSSVLAWACNLGHTTCLSSATEKLKSFVESNGEQKIEPNLQTAVYCYGLKSSDDSSIWYFLWNRYKTSNDAFEQTLILQNLGCTEDESILEEFLHYSINDTSGIRRQDASTAFAAVYGNPVGVDVALKFLSENFDKINTYYGSMGSIGNIVRGIAAQISTEDQRKEFENFLEVNSNFLGTIRTAAQQTVNENFDWSATYQTQIFDALRPEGGGGDGSGMISPSGLMTFLISLILYVVYYY